jgi:CheY-like chemotaxis protein
VVYNPAETKVKKAKTVKSHISKNANNLNVLIVEDDYASALYLSTIFKDLTENIQIAKDGIEAIEMCKNNSSFNLVLMDVKLPKLNGLEATKRIRNFDKEVKIIAQTANALEGDRELAIKAGCDEYISKPINREKLLELTEKLI